MGETQWFTMSEETQLLVSAETYEENAVNIGTQQKSADMSRFIDRVREDGLYLLDIATTDQRIRSIAALLNTYDAPSIMVVSARQYGQRPARMFAEAIGAHSAVGRFIPGSLTNPALRSYIEPDILFVTDPANDQQALREAVASGPPSLASLMPTTTSETSTSPCQPTTRVAALSRSFTGSSPEKCSRFVAKRPTKHGQRRTSCQNGNLPSERPS